MEDKDVSADDDKPGREAIWRAICSAAEQLLSQCAIMMRPGEGALAQSLRGQPVPHVKTWQLVEGLSLLAVLLRADRVVAEAVTLFKKVGPLEIREDALPRYVWSQYTVPGHLSDLDGRPDLIVTSTAAPPTPANILRVVEVKCVRRLGTTAVRAEFAKAHDLRVKAYAVWSYFAPESRIVAGAKGLGIDLHELGLGSDSSSRSQLTADPAALLSKVVNTLDLSRREERFARQLMGAGEDVERKRLPAIDAGS